MTRKGKQPISLPTGVDVQVQGSVVTIKGPKGTLKHDLVPGIIVKIENNNLVVSVDDGANELKAFHGLHRTLINNLVLGITKGFERKLEMVGVGYRAAVQGHNLNLFVGFSHPTLIPIPDGIQVKVEKNTVIVLNGINKQQIGQFAASVRSIRPPEPYQGKGIRYEGEYVRKKAGKAAAAKGK
jgi:large subunit ribosomal protein L6